MKTEYAYDPELPWIIWNYDHIVARFKFFDDAEATKRFQYTNSYEVIDTTPKPKIPEDAQYVTWPNKDVPEYVMFAMLLPEWHPGRGKGYRWTDQDQSWYTDDQLIREIGDAEVTVLVPKETS